MARKSQAKLHQSDAIGVKLEGEASTSLNLLAGLLREKALRSATYAGAKILYEEMKVRAESQSKTGQLSRAIYHWHDDKKSTLDSQSYVIGVNKREAPHWHLIEFGHWMPYVTYKGKDGLFHTKRINGKPVMRMNPKFIPAQPYVRPTWDAKRDMALAAMKQKLAENLKAGK